MVASGFRRVGYLSFMNQISKSNMGWPQQPPTEKVLKSVKRMIFDDPFHRNGIGHFGARDDQTIRMSNSFLIK